VAVGLVLGGGRHAAPLPARRLRASGSAAACSTVAWQRAPPHLHPGKRNGRAGGAAAAPQARHVDRHEAARHQRQQAGRQRQQAAGAVAAAVALARAAAPLRVGAVRQREAGKRRHRREWAGKGATGKRSRSRRCRMEKTAAHWTRRSDAISDAILDSSRLSSWSVQPRARGVCASWREGSACAGGEG